MCVFIYIACGMHIYLNILFHSTLCSLPNWYKYPLSLHFIMQKFRLNMYFVSHLNSILFAIQYKIASNCRLNPQSDAISSFIVITDIVMIIMSEWNIFNWVGITLYLMRFRFILSFCHKWSNFPAHIYTSIKMFISTPHTDQCWWKQSLY